MNKRLPAIIAYFICNLCILSSCKEGKVEFNSNDCKGTPAFIQSLGFDPRLSHFSTSEVQTMGLVLLQSDEPGNPNARITKTFQYPSWRMGGWLAPVNLDENGNLFTAPAPSVNILYNPIANNNTIYRIDSKTGVMEEFMRLPFADSINTENPFGIIGMTYLCESGILYVSSIAGSRRYAENGHIYAIDIKKKKIIDQLNNADAMGMGISYITGHRKLYYGTGRNSGIMSVTINSNGKFTGTPQKEFTLDNLGPRGDDKVRRIRTDQFGNLIIHGMEFNYNLIAPREKQETIYNFYYDEEGKKWIQR
jgi:hypothetical protein